MQNNNFDIYNLPMAGKNYMKTGLYPAEQKIVDKYFKHDGAHILDIGCGTGRTTAYFSRFDNKIIAIDYSESMIRMARERFPELNFMVADARRMPFENADFDIAFFSFNGIDYIYPKRERLEAIVEIWRVLKPGGLFVYSSHNRFRLPIGRTRLKSYMKNLARGTLFSEYSMDFCEYGPLLTYWGSIWSEKIDLKKSGFKFLDFFGNKYSSSISISLLESYTYYVFRK
ncbi:MAG: hypothetical protein COV31_00180 [Candidatus Yanofskybacteria bacterium CG10_big_fil_rev_8_21_14_0_10_46_23]|uniref:Methyltransferase domain-containing protein n=1 Tax=Candidatus Yanofskybacteria bacterium CG10_big_fil_rev_8_21_14_0_10_46_23 TaxID=1975098 RepID=A0A2H0R543_9BACT|nr:MAG: hypothetical protein COV31_00180 [Candidatus Yanofskybacteria bacterium CG10_big_fil_rev_8_21_14_0_10_46_23]